MSQEPATTCPEPDLNALLPWLVNGTLRGQEEERVRAHVDRCAICREELDALSQVALSVHEHALPAPVTGSRPAHSTPAPGLRRPIVLALTTAIAAGSILVTFLVIRGTRRVPGGSPLPPGPAAVLDLGAGALRGDSEAPALRLGPETKTARLLFFVHPDPDSRVDLELRSDAGELLHAAQGLPPPDSLGRSALEVPATALRGRTGGLLLVREAGPGGEERIHRFPFRIEAGNAQGQP